MNDAVAELLSLNSVDQQTFSIELYRTLMCSTFATLVKEIEAADAWSEVRARFHSFPDHVHVTKLLVSKFVGGKYRPEDYELLYELLNAHLRKHSQRKRYPDKVKEELIARQDYKCAICGTPIDLTCSELDHVIPWSLVGDELRDNLQMLCIQCNRRKSATIDYALLSTFFSKR